MKPDTPRKDAAPPPRGPAAWKPYEIRLGVDHLYELHRDGKVYERRRNMGVLANPEHGRTVRRVKDREIVAQVYAAYRKQSEERTRLQDRAVAIAKAKGGTP